MAAARVRPRRGLLLTSVVTLGVVPLLYVVLVEDLKLVAWRPTERDDDAAPGLPRPAAS